MCFGLQYSLKLAKLSPSARSKQRSLSKQMERNGAGSDKVLSTNLQAGDLVDGSVDIGTLALPGVKHSIDGVPGCMIEVLSSSSTHRV